MVKTDGKLTVTVGVDVFCVAAFQHLAAGFLPAVACQRDAERAGVPVGYPGPLGPVADSVFRVVSAPVRLTRRLTPLGRLAGFWFLVAFTMRATSP